jgi:hypothetical protein
MDSIERGTVMAEEWVAKLFRALPQESGPGPGTEEAEWMTADHNCGIRTTVARRIPALWKAVLFAEIAGNRQLRALTHRRLQASRSADQEPVDVWQQRTVGGASMPVIAS